MPASPTAAPPVTFSTFVISLAHSALAQLGDPAQEASSTPPTHADRELAAHTLQLLEMLAEKTKGNLDHEEQHLFDAVRAEIRTRIG